MNQKNEALVPQEGEILDAKNAGIVVTERGLDYENFVGLWKLSKLLVASGMVPKVKDGTSHEERVSQIAICVARGKTVGLDAFQSVESIVPINGRPMIWGNAPLAICRQHPGWDESGFDEFWEVKGQRQDSHPAKFDDDSTTAVCATLRKGASKPMVRRFSVADAKRAGLWGTTGKLYGAYPQRMLPARARGYCLNDNFGDSLKGIAIRETFDEEVDGKPPVSNVDELRERMDKAKTRHISDREALETLLPRDIAETFPKQTIDDRAKQLDGAGVIVSGSSNKVEKNTIRDRVKQLDQDLSALDQSRGWLKKVYDKIPMKIDRVEALKSSSMEDGTWISFEHIDSISDLEYLNRIAGRLEEMLSQAVGAKA